MNFEDYGLEGEMLEKAKADYAKDIKGLKDKNADLIDREKTAKLELEEMVISLEQAKHDSAKELAEKNGSIEQFKAALADEKEQMELLKVNFQQEKDAHVLESAFNEFSSVIVDHPADRNHIKSIFESGLEVKEGVVVTKDQTLTVEAFKQGIISDKVNAKCFKANVGSGAGSAGSDGGFNTVKSPKEMNEAERAEFKQSDPEGFRRAFNLN